MALILPLAQVDLIPSMVGALTVIVGGGLLVCALLIAWLWARFSRRKIGHGPRLMILGSRPWWIAEDRGLCITLENEGELASGCSLRAWATRLSPPLNAWAGVPPPDWAIERIAAERERLISTREHYSLHLPLVQARSTLHECWLAQTASASARDELSGEAPANVLFPADVRRSLLVIWRIECLDGPGRSMPAEEGFLLGSNLNLDQQ